MKITVTGEYNGKSQWVATWTHEGVQGEPVVITDDAWAVILDTLKHEMSFYIKNTVNKHLGVK